MPSEATRRSLSPAGLFAGPLAWLAHTEASYAVVPWVCAHQWPAVPILALAGVVVSFGGVYLSWRSLPASDDPHEPGSARAGTPLRFMAQAGILVSLLFALVILLQGSAGLVLNGCER